MNLRKRFYGQLYGMTCHEKCLGRGNRYVAGEMLKAGIKIIQYREKYRSMGEKLRECIWLRKETKKYGALLIVNDDPILAIACRADGLHLGQDDMPVEHARKLTGGRMLIGVSTHNPRQAMKAVKDGASYVGVGPVFATKTKEGVCKPVGLSYVRYAAKNLPVPFVAIGGIKEHNVDSVLDAGAECVCLVTGITASKNIRSKVTRVFSRIRNKLHS